MLSSKKKSTDPSKLLVYTNARYFVNPTKYAEQVGRPHLQLPPDYYGNSVVMDTTQMTFGELLSADLATIATLVKTLKGNGDNIIWLVIGFLI